MPLGQARFWFTVKLRVSEQEEMRLGKQARPGSGMITALSSLNSTPVETGQDRQHETETPPLPVP